MLGESRRDVFTRRELFLAAAFLGTTCAAIYGFVWWLDFGRDEHHHSLFDLLTEPGTVNTLTNFSDITIGVLGVALTVVTIIVELASNRYTPRITELFIRDPVNGAMMGFYVCTAILVMWVQMSLYSGHHPVYMVALVFVLLTTSLLSLLPYFAYVFDFLLPTRVVTRIEQRSADAIRTVRRQGVAAIPAARVEVLTAIEQLGEIAVNSVEKKDKGISIAALQALTDLAGASLAEKKGLPPEWFDTLALTHGDQDFIAMHPDIVLVLAQRRTWVDMKVLRQFQGAFEQSLHGMRDIAHLIAILTRKIAERAADHDDTEGVRIAVRFLNTFMRATLNLQDQKTAYHLMNEYRLLGEALLSRGKEAEVLVLAERTKFYGQLAFRMKQPFILETAAYDLCALLEKAHDANAPCHDALLTIFLDVDRAPDDLAQEASLRGVRKAQAKLATHYLLRGDLPRVQRIWDDMKHEPKARLHTIRAELLAVGEAEFWEVSDRGANFDWLPADRRAQLDRFFAWFDAPENAPKSA